MKTMRKNQRPFLRVYISRADYDRLLYLLASTGSALCHPPVKAPSSQGHSQMSDFGLLWSFVVLALYNYTGGPLYKFEPNGNTLKGTLFRRSVPLLATVFSFVQQFRDKRLNENQRLLLNLFYCTLNHYACNSTIPVPPSGVAERERFRCLLESCYPPCCVLDDAGEVRRRNRRGSFR